MEFLKKNCKEENGKLFFTDRLELVTFNDEESIKYDWFIYLDEINLFRKIKKNGFCIAKFHISYKNEMSKEVINKIFINSNLFPVWKNANLFNCAIHDSFINYEKKVIQCFQCDKFLKNNRGLIRHKLLHHRTPTPSSS